MNSLAVFESDDLQSGRQREAESLVRSAFGADFRSHDWLHCVGGTHVLVTDRDTVIAHASVVPRSLWHDGQRVDTGYVEGVAVRADQQGRGLGRLLMDRVEGIVNARYDIGALNAIDTAAAFYAGRGWRRWTGPTAASTPDGIVRTDDVDDRIFLWDAPFEGAARGRDVPLVCDWRSGDLW